MTTTTAEERLRSRSAERLAIIARFRRRAVIAQTVRLTLAYGILVLVSCVTLVPLYWALATSLKSYQEIVAYPPVFWPKEALWSNYTFAMGKMNFLRSLRNTLILALGPTFGTVISASLVAYGFAKLRSPIRDGLFIFVLSTMMLPGFVTFIPVFVMYYRLHWTNTFFPFLVGSWFGGGAWNIFLLRQFFRTIPDDLLDSARVDGAPELRILFQIVMPLAKPILATIFLFSFMGGWNDYFGPYIYLTKKELYPFALAIYKLRFEIPVTTAGATGGSGASVSENVVMAASLLVSAPLLVLFFFTQRYFIEGITITGMRG